MVKKWIKALRSGEYKQGKHELRSQNDKYCCLGVACRVLGVSKDKLYWQGVPSEVDDKRVMALLKDESFVDTLVQKNDKRGHSFQDIARVLEEGAEF